MYPQFAESQSVRGLPDMSRNQVRFPYHQYYGSKMGEGMGYPSPAMVRPSGINPYTGKPSHEAMYAAGAGSMAWNSMMGGHPSIPPGMVPPPHMQAKPMMSAGTKMDYNFPGQEQMMRGYHPELMNSGGHYPPNYMYPPMAGGGGYSHHPSYLPHPSSLHPHHPPQMDGYSMPPPPPPSQQQQQQPSNNSVVWDGSTSTTVSSTNINSPSRNWTGQQDMINDTTLHPPSVGNANPGTATGNYQSSQSPTPNNNNNTAGASGNNSNELQKGHSVSSLKDALSNPPPPQSLHDSTTTPSSNKPYSFNASSYLNVGGDSLISHTSPRTPNATTPDPSTPNISGIIGNSETSNPSPLTTPQNDLSGSHGNNTGPQPRQNSPFEVESILGFNKDNRTLAPPTTIPGITNTENGRDALTISKSPSQNKKSNSPPSSVNSPATKKQRSPSFTTVIRSHPSLASQFNLSDEPGRKDFLDTLYKYMEQESIPFLKPPSINKSVIDLYKTFTAVQSLGGFTHVVDKRLWKDVLKSFCTSNSSSSSSLRTLSEYYVNVLLPYECHMSRNSFTDCVSHYELSHRLPNETTPTPGGPVPPPVVTTDDSKEPNRTKSLDNLLDGNERDNLIFSEDSLPDISVQEAESVLGISTSNSGGPQPPTPSPSFPPGWASPSASGDQTIGEPPMVPASYHPGPHPGGVGPGFHGYYGMPDYMGYQRRNMMSPYVIRGPYPPNFQTHLDDASSYNYPPPPPHFGGPHMEYGQHNMMSGGGGGGGSDWPWGHPSMMQRTTHLPPPLPPHLQSMMFNSPPPPLSISPRPPTPQTQQQSQSSSEQQQIPVTSSSTSSSPALPPSLDPPIKIMVTDQQGQSVDNKLTPPLSQKHSSFSEIKELPKPPMVNKEVTEKPLLHQTYKRPVEPIESFQPQMLKRRRLNCDHCGNVEPWRVMMSLKCGLPSDSTWALDTLTILLHDDRTVGFFYLKHHHSLLNTLVNHFNSCLFQVFGSPFQILDKFEESTTTTTNTNTTSFSTDYQPPPTASVYHYTSTDVRMGLSDHLWHMIHSSPVIDILQEKNPSNHPLLTQRECKEPVLRVDETRVEELLKRDALTERILLHLKTPRRLMARSPIQKYFLPPQQLAEDNEGEETCEKERESQKNDREKSPLREENEVIKREVLPFTLIPSQRESLKYRTLSLSNILRSLSFIPGNDIEFSQHPGLLLILGHLLLLHHVHLHSQPRSSRVYNQDEESMDETPPPTITEDFWWWPCLDVLRENAFVILANVGGQLDFSIYPEAITYPLISGLLHWLVCPSSVATDPLPDSALVYSLSPQRLVVEALAKISISEANVDYILATPPLTRLDLVFATLLQFIGQKKYPAVRQFALVLLSDLAQGGEGASRMIGQQKMTLPLLLECLESSANVSAKTRYMSSQYTDDVNSLSLAMLRRAAVTLHCMAKVPVNRISFLPYSNRLLALSMSEVLDSSLTSILSDVLFELTRLL